MTIPSLAIALQKRVLAIMGVEKCTLPAGYNGENKNPEEERAFVVTLSDGTKAFVTITAFSDPFQ